MLLLQLQLQLQSIELFKLFFLPFLGFVLSGLFGILHCYISTKGKKYALLAHQ
jgi:hypothetical protein